MLSPVGRVSSNAPRRSRGRIWPFVLVGLLLALVVGEVIYQVVSSSGTAARQSARSWVSAVGPIVDQENALIPTLDEVRAKGSGLSRVSLDALLGELTEGTAQAQQELAALPLAPPTASSGAALSSVLSQRARACSTLAGAVSLAATSGSSSTQVLEELGSVASELRSADAEYLRFEAGLPPGVRADRLPSSAWIRRPATWSSTGLARWAAALQGAKALVGRSALTLVAVSLEPRPLQIQGLPATTSSAVTADTTTATTSSSSTTVPGGASISSTTTSSSTTTTTLPPTTTTLQLPPSGSVSVLQPTRKVTVVVVLASTGNTVADGVQLQASLTSIDGGSAGSSPAVVSEHLGSLAPGAARYLRLRSMRVRPGQRYRLLVTASFSGGAPVSGSVTISVHS